MSNETERRSMDDVLASIRRIIRSDKGPGADISAPKPPSAAPEPAPSSEPADNAPLALTPDMMVSTSADSDQKKPETDNAPLPFTSAAPTSDVSPSSGQVMAQPVPADPEKTVVPAPVAPESTAPVVAAPQASAPLVLDEAAIEGMVRRVLHEELMGQIGQNISANVQRMIEAEVAKLGKKGD